MLWEKYNKLVNLQERADAVKVLDQILEDNPYDTRALKEKMCIADYYFDEGAVLSRFVAGESLEKVALYYVRTLFDKEFRHMRVLSNDEETLEAMKNSYVWAKIEAIYKHYHEKQLEQVNWSDLPDGYFFQLIDSQKRYSFDEWENSECRKFETYIKTAYHDDYYLDEISTFILLKDKQMVVFKARSRDGDYTSFIAFKIADRGLIAPQNFANGDFEFKPSFFHKRYEFHRIGNSNSLKNRCKIFLSSFHDDEVFAFTFGENETVYFTKTESRVEERGNIVEYGWGTNGIPFRVNLKTISEFV